MNFSRIIEDPKNEYFSLYKEYCENFPNFCYEFSLSQSSEEFLIDVETGNKVSTNVPRGSLVSNAINETNKFLIKVFDIIPKAQIRFSSYSGGDSKTYLLDDDENMFIASINFDYEMRISRFITVLSMDRLSDLFINKISNLCILNKKNEDVLKIISHNKNYGFRFIETSITKKQHIFDYKNYNDDFKEVSERIINDLSENDTSGLVLLHGVAGTGKTNFLKYLTHVLKKDLIYLPPDMTSYLSSPDFINFLMGSAQNSILLIEDAENVLKSREAGGSQSVSNILNISDGILGDILNIQIVCTFNCSIEEIDSALLRPLRLIAEYRFSALSPDKTSALIRELYDVEEWDDSKSLTLAQIYGYKEFPLRSKETKIKMGFI